MRRLVYLGLVSVPALLASPPFAFTGEAGNSDEDEEQSAPTENTVAAKSAPVAFDKKWLAPFFASGLESRAAAH
ncbi:MAG TPA: hypothetical protein VF524_11315, partial [Polyangia bacterium]